MAERTEEQKILQEGVKVILGGKEYEIKPLPIKYSSEWRKKSIPIIVYFMELAQIKDTDSKDARGKMADLFTSKLDAIQDSFFMYARDLNRDEIEEVATDAEIVMAFMEVFGAFVSPFGKIQGEMGKNPLP